MVAVAIIAVSVVALAVLHVVATTRKYERLKAERKAKEIQDARDELAKALKEHPQDVLLHATLYDRVKRLRNQ